MPQKPSRITDLLDDPDRLPQFLSSLAQEAVADIAADVSSELPSEYVQNALDILVTRHCRIVFNHTQSPIERVWINSLQAQFLRSSSMLVATPPISDFPDFHQGFQRTLMGVDNFLSWYGRRGGNLGQLDEYFDELVRSGQMDLTERDSTYCTVMDYGLMPYRHAFHITPQAGFPGCGPQGGDIRIDAFIWLPDRADVRVAVECDGYTYHATKSSFTRDRQRDRRLNALGIRVFRFSGSEINANPVEAVGDLYEYLTRAADQKNTDADGGK